MAIHDLGAVEVAARVAAGEIAVEAVLCDLLARIDATEPIVGAYLHVDREAALAEARELDRRISMGESVGPLAGVPVAVKDNICIRGQPTTAASLALAGYRPPYDATVVERIRAAGGIVLGRTNLDEFAMGSSTETAAAGVTRNPWDADRIPGGSSGGSAAAVAARSAMVALGSDTGGSIRQPAAMCGVTGLKPTYGRVSRYGLIAFASSLDQIGPLARSAEDCALLLGVLAGHDPRDATSADRPTPGYLRACREGVRGLRLGVPREYFGEGIEPDVAAAVRDGIEALAGLGCSIEEVSLPHTEYAVPTYYIVCTAEASSNLARYDGVHYGPRAHGARGLAEQYARTRAEGFGAEVKRRILLGTYVLSSGYYDAYYLRALKVRTLIRRDFQEVFGRVDALICPTSPMTAFRRGERIDDPIRMYLCDVLTASANLAGVPGINVPCGLDGRGLPIGLQVLAPAFEEVRLLRIARAFQEATDHHLRLPAIGGKA